ncbi:MAG: transposase [Sideroxyarcus sp.]|nr:transposase [Sideroxyarcus sp.]
MHYRRDKSAHCYFFTLVTERRQPLLTLPDNIERLRAAFRREKSTHPFGMDAVVILPDHLHCIWQLPNDDTDYSGRWARIKRYFSVGCAGAILPNSESRSAKRERPIWQRRFWEHRIRDDDDWKRHMDYIHFNPVKHGHANDPWTWPYSSLQQCAARGWYPENWCLEAGDADDIEAGE